MVIIALISLCVIVFLAWKISKNTREQKELACLHQVLTEKERELEELKVAGKNDVQRIIEREEKLVKTISHELRIPISIIKGYSDILADGLVEDEASKQKYLRKISDKTEHLTELVSSMVSEMEKNLVKNGEAPIVFCNLANVINAVAEDFKLAAEKKQIVINVHQSQPIVHAFCDTVRITQVISNIVNNSIKYMGRPGSVQLSLGYSEKDEVTLIIRDNGVGMEAEAASTVFDTTQGLGLKICKETVESYGGSIWCKSEKEKGMAVYITLPVRERA